MQIGGTADTQPSQYDLKEVYSFAVGPSGSMTVRFLIQMATNFQRGMFLRYDYGPEVNLAVYGTEEPPEYPIQDSNVPLALFFLEYDGAYSEENMELILNKYGDNVIYSELYPVNHFFASLDKFEVVRPVYEDMVEVLTNSR